MVIKKKQLLFLPAAIILCTLYIYQVINVNLSYQRLHTGWDEIYHLGEEVVLGENYIDLSLQAKGYSICAEKIEIVETSEYVTEKGLSLDNRGASVPERLALVYATVHNVGSDTTDFPLLLFEMYGNDTYTVADFELFYQINTDIEYGDWGICVPHGAEQNVVIPFRLNRDDFNLHTWSHLRSYPFSLKLTYGPAQMIIELTEV